MLQLIETICWENGDFQRLPLHEERMFRSVKHFYGTASPISLAEVLDMPASFREQKVKCRITYSDHIEKIDYEPYTPKSVKSLQLVPDDSIDYSYKLLNRDALNRLYALRGESDDILIVKEGRITDSSYANVIFLKDGIWFTPEFPLLKGTRRAYYLQQGMIRTMSIRPGDVKQFEAVRLINAMLSMEEGESIPVSGIR